MGLVSNLDIWVNVAKHLDVPDILKLFRLSKHHRKLSTRDDVWASIFRCHYGIWSKEEFPDHSWCSAKGYLLNLRRSILSSSVGNGRLFRQLLVEHQDKLYTRSPSKAMVMYVGCGREEWLREGDLEINHDPDKYGGYYRFKTKDGFSLTPTLAFCWPHKPLDYCTAQGQTFLDYTKESLAACTVTAHVHSPYPRPIGSGEEACQCKSCFDGSVQFSEIRDPRCSSLILIMTVDGYDALKWKCNNLLHIPRTAYLFSANTRWALLEI